MKIFLTGERNIGKSTIIRSVIERMKCSIGGFIQIDNSQNGNRRFKFVNLYSGECSDDIYSMRENRITFDKFAGIMKRSMAIKREMIVMDELGFLELSSEKFRKIIHEMLDYSVNIIGVLKRHNNSFIQSIKKRKDVTVIEVTKENRDGLADEIIEIYRQAGLKIKNESGFFNKRSRIEYYNAALEDENNTYPDKIIELIEKKIEIIGDNNSSILEIGAGTGALAIPLAKKGFKITAVDSSINMYESLIERISEKGVENIECVLAPWENVKFGEYDYIISAFCSNNFILGKYIDKLLRESKRGAFIIIHRERSRRNFKRNDLMRELGREAKHYNVIGSDLREIFDRRNINYEKIDCDLKLHQRFNCIGEAVEFITDHFVIKGDNDKRITEEFVADNTHILNGQVIFENYKRVEFIYIMKE